MTCSMRWLAGNGKRGVLWRSRRGSYETVVWGVMGGVRSRIHCFLDDDFVGIDAKVESVVMLRENTDRRKSIRRPPADKLVARSKVVLISWWLCPLSVWDSPAVWEKEIVFGESISWRSLQLCLWSLFDCSSVR
jgi:hypothetical protein